MVARPPASYFRRLHFQKPDLYLTLLSFGSFAHYDEGTYTSKGLTPDQAKELSNERGPAILSNEESALQLSYPALQNRDGWTPIVLITEIRLNPGRRRDFIGLIRDRLTLGFSRDSGAGRPNVEIFQTEANGDPDRLFLFQHLRKFADLDTVEPLWSTSPKSKQSGFEEAYARCVRSSFVTVMQFRNDLSAFSK